VKRKVLKSKEQRKNNQYRLDVLKLVILVAAILTIVAFLYKPAIGLLQEENRQVLKEQIDRVGFPAHLLFIGGVAAQVVLSIIPVGATMPILGGFFFGPILGIMYTTLGIVLGSALAFYLGRKFGRPILEDYIEPKTLQQFDKQSEHKGLITLLFIFLIPFTPDNAICIVAGATRMKIRNMVAVVAIGRLPGTIIGCMIGSGLESAFSPAMIITITVLILLLGMAYVKQKEIEEKIKKVL
jgi:uncharacterized membrane protein YdjX (TVP38/TMEM64 family)